MNRTSRLPASIRSLLLCRWIGVLLLAVLSPARGDPALEVIELRYRSADELIPVLRPLAGEVGTVSGQGRHLFLQVPPGRLEDLRQAVGRLDQPAQPLLVSVYQGRLSDGQLRALGIWGQGSTDGSGASRVLIDARRVGTRNTLDATHRLRVAEGERAHVATATAYPLPQGAIAVGPAGVYQAWGSPIYESVSGFFVTTRLAADDRVVLELSPSREIPAGTGTGYESMRASTRVSGPLGQWIVIAGHSADTAGDDAGAVRRRATDSRDQGWVLIKVERAPP